MKSISGRTALLIAAPAIFIVAFYVAPLLYVGWISVSEPQLGLGNFAKFFRSGYMVTSLTRTVMMALTVTVTSLLMAYPVAFMMAVGSKMFARILAFVVMSSFLVSFLVRTFAWLVILGRGGPAQTVLEFFGWSPPPRLLYTTFASTLTMTQMLAPLMCLVLYATMRRIDPALMMASRSLGASSFRTLLHVYLPLSLPGVINGATLIFITCLGFYVTPAILGSPQSLMISGLIARQLGEMLQFGLAAASSIILTLFTGVLFLIYSRFSSVENLWKSR